MLIHEMTDQQCLDTLARLRLGRLGCARDNQPYVVPIYFASQKRQLYAFATLGEKIKWMRANPRVCIEVDELITHNQWISVVVFGHYEEFPDTPEYQPERNRAYELLQRHAMWWQPAYVASAHRGDADPLIPIFFCIHIDRVTGHRAMLDSVEAAALAGPRVAHHK
jgi:nitroimidazol reductase NimA-like FMN-containing flavoprotein (pyridoxamine 5'-phosphate oxidase superfamily)